MSKSRDIADSAATINYIDGLTSDAQGQLNDKATLDGSPTFTGTVTATAFSGDGSSLTGVDSLPSQTGNTGKFLTTDGSAASWDALSTGYTVLGPYNLPAGQQAINIDDIPAGAKHIILTFWNMRYSSNTNTSVYLRTSAGSHQTDYNGYSMAASATTWNLGGGVDDRFEFKMNNSSYEIRGRLYLTLSNEAENQWDGFGVLNTFDTDNTSLVTGATRLPSALTGLRISGSTAWNGSNGYVQITYI